MHQIPVDTIIVYIQTNTIPPLNPLHFILCFGRGSTVLFVFFLFCREDYNGIIEFHRKDFFFFINKELYFFSQLLKYYM